MSKRDELAEHLRHAGRDAKRSAYETQAERILANPQEHVDALVAVTVLELHVDAGGAIPRCYNVVVPAKLPHVHDWRVAGYFTSGVNLRCDCGEMRQAENRLPIEIPEASDPVPPHAETADGAQPRDR